MYAFINSSDEEDSSGADGGYKERSDSNPPVKSIYDAMYCHNEPVMGSNIERVIRDSGSEPPLPHKRKRKTTFYDSSDEDSDAESSPLPFRERSGCDKDDDPSLTPDSGIHLGRSSTMTIGDLLFEPLDDSGVTTPTSMKNSLCYESPSIVSMPPPKKDSKNSGAHDDTDTWMDSAADLPLTPHIVDPPTASGGRLPHFRVQSSSRQVATRNPRKVHRPASAIEQQSLEVGSMRPMLLVDPVRLNAPLILSLSTKSDGGCTRGQVPGSAARYLKDYQVDGVKWMWSKYASGEGCILGDDMGLGKTVQIAVLLLAVFGKTGMSADDCTRNIKRRRDGMSEFEPPCLIVTPASVVENWQRELRTWGYFEVGVLGSNAKGECDKVLADALKGSLDIVLGSYDKMTMYAAELAKISWSVITWDEGHILKSDTGKRYRAAFSLSKAKCRIILSGTLVQNDLEELWALLNIVTLGRFHDKGSFKSHFVKPIKRAKQRSAHPDAISTGIRRQLELKKLLKRYLLQRMKTDVLSGQLLGKDDIVVFCELSSIQGKLYQHILSLPDVDNARRYLSLCPCGKGVKRRDCCEEYQVPLLRDAGVPGIDPRAVIWRQNHADDEPCSHCPSCIILPAITKLSKVASHPALLQEHAYSVSDGKSTPTYDFAVKALPPDLLHEIGGPVKSSQLLDASCIARSGKMKILDKLLTTFSLKLEKTLVFSHSTKMLSLIESYVQSRGWRYSRLDGSTSSSSRQHLVDRFNTDKSILLFLISTKAGGLGLNLTSASKVVIFDCNWNPGAGIFKFCGPNLSSALDMQAQDRAYRFGQTRRVSVYRLVAQGTVEELIYMRQLYKQALQRTAVRVSNSGQEDGEDHDGRFEGIQGEVAGELFGIENLLQYEKGSILLKLREKYDNDSSDEVKVASGGIDSNGKSLYSTTDLKSVPISRKKRVSAADALKDSVVSIGEGCAISILSQLVNAGESGGVGDIF